jgi:hypothetical protein
MTVPSRGAVYVCSGDRYINEAIRSARSVRAHNPNLPICLIADKFVDSDAFTTLIVNEQALRTIEDKLEMDRAPYDHCLFIDSDTWISGDLSPVFQMLERFDLVGHQCSGGYHYKLPEVPHAFPEFNTGVIGFRKSPGMTRFFAEWKRLFKRYIKEMGREWDQRSFRHAVYEADYLRHAVLHAEFNIMNYHVNDLGGPIILAHGRSHEEIIWMTEQANQRLGPRMFVSRLGVFREPSRMRLGETITLVLRVGHLFVFESVKRAIRATLGHPEFYLRGKKR